MESDPGKSTAEKAREWVQVLLLVFASVWGAVWGYYSFWYKEIIVPSRRPAALVISGSLEDFGRKAGMALLRARVHVVNNRDTKIYAPALWITLKGLQISAKTISVKQLDPTPEEGQSPSEKFSFYSEDDTNVVARWRLPDWNTWYEPGDETTNDELFYVPLGLYEATQLTVDVIVTKSIDEVASVRWDVAADGTFSPTLMLKGRGYASNPELVEPFEPDGKWQHKQWEVKNGVGHNWSVTTLSLLHAATEGKKATQ